MKYDSDDALDRALFALPLEEPPEDLRASILTATVYRPVPVFAAWEIAAIGAVAAVGIWFAVVIALGGGTLFVHTVDTIGQSFTHAFSNYRQPGMDRRRHRAAMWLSLFTGSQPYALATKGCTQG